MAHFMAYLMAACIPHSWLTSKDTPVLVPIPARKAAVRRRGYDHLSLLVNELQIITALPHLNALEASDRHDQRSLDAKERLQNMKDSFAVRITPVPKRVILIDDVFTTGATLFAAAEALRNAGTREVYGLTFIRA